MQDQVRIEKRNNRYEILLVESGSAHVMDTRPTWEEAEDFAFYLAKSLRLAVYFKGKRCSR